MKRHPALLQLSREHHGALRLARDARRAAASGMTNAIATLSQRAVDLFATELDPHFRTEEEGVLPHLARAGQHELVQRTLDEHAEMRRLAERLAIPDAGTLLRFGTLLGSHVRFEERELFEAVQLTLPSGNATRSPVGT